MTLANIPTAALIDRPVSNCWCYCGRVILSEPHYRFEWKDEDAESVHTPEKCRVKETKVGGSFMCMRLTLG